MEGFPVGGFVTTALIVRGERAIICKAAFTASRHAAVTSGETTIRPELGKKTCRSLNERIGLLTGQSVPIFRCGRERRFNADRHVFDDQ
jgi:hypothetical protein